MVRSSRSLWLVIYIVFGLYFINFGLDFVSMPSIIQDVNKWITLVGGILIIVGGFNYYRRARFKGL